MTFESVPAAYSSVNSNLVYVVYDIHATDPVLYPNYKYVAEVYIDAVLVHTDKVFPQPDSLRGIFDFGSVIREYVINNLDITGTGLVAQNGPPGTWATKDVVVKLYEEYAGTIGAVVLTDSARVFYNHYEDVFAGTTYLANFPEELCTARDVRKIQITLNGTGKYFVPYFAEVAGSFDVEITDNFNTTNTHTVTTSGNNWLVLFNFSPFAINQVFPGFISSATTSYNVAFSTGGSQLDFEIICAGMYQNYYVHFLNRFGGFESMLFNKVSKRSIDTEKKTYRQLPYRVSSAGVVSYESAYQVKHEQNTTFAGRFKSSLRISTDWLSDIDYAWLADLVASPMVYLQYGSILYPAQITDTNYELKQHVVDSLQNLTLNIEFGTTYKTQFR